MRQGDCLASIARLYGIPDWRVIYRDDANEELRRSRPNPHVLLPGDEISIPDAPARPGRFDVRTGQEASMVLDRPTTLLRLRVLDHVQGAGVEARYRLELEGVPEPIEGSIGADGKLEVPIPDGARSARLTLLADPGGELLDLIELRVGELDPPSSATGALERLRRIGFDPGPDEEGLGPAAEAALRDFQRDNGLRESGELTQETQDKLVELVGA